MLFNHIPNFRSLISDAEQSIISPCFWKIVTLFCCCLSFYLSLPLSLTYKALCGTQTILTNVRFNYNNTLCLVSFRLQHQGTLSQPYLLTPHALLHFTIQVLLSWFVATLFLALLLCRFVSLVFKAVHETHCFLRDSTHSMRCSNFTLVSFPLQNTTGWLCVSVITSTICLLALPTIPEFRG